MDRHPFHPALVAVTVGLLLVFFATACGSSDDPPSPAKVEPYRAFLEESSANLVRTTERLLAKIEAGDVPGAKSHYATARVSYGQVQPAAASFDNLDARIDALEGEVPVKEFGGFHRIEKALADERTTKGMTPVARQLLADIEELQQTIKTAPLKAHQIADSADELINDLALSTVNGVEQPYMHIDVIDVAARIEGAEAAFKALKPPLADADPQLAEEIEAGFAKAYAALRPWGTAAREPDQPRPQEPGTAFVLYLVLDNEAVQGIAKPLDALVELFDQVPDQISGE